MYDRIGKLPSHDSVQSILQCSIVLINVDAYSHGTKDGGQAKVVGVPGLPCFVPPYAEVEKAVEGCVVWLTREATHESAES